MNCRQLFPDRQFANTHGLFPQIAAASRGWLLREILVCKPKIIITLGEVAARVVRDSKAVLDGKVHDWSEDGRIKVAHLAHPEIRRLNKTWDKKTVAQLASLARQLPKFL